jgi:hypothetical protein
MNGMYYLLAVKKYACRLNELSTKVPKHRARFQSYAIIRAWSIYCICHYIEIVHVGHISDSIDALAVGLALPTKFCPLNHKL